MENNPKSLHQEYSKLGIQGDLIGAIRYATFRIRDSGICVLDRHDTGDIVTQADLMVHDAFVEYFSKIGQRVLINGEEGASSEIEPEYLVLLDPIEGTQNFVNGLDYGINSAVAPYKPQIKVKEITASAVANLREDTIFSGTRGEGVLKLRGGKIEELVRKQTDVYEMPLSTAYTTDILQRARQSILANVFYNILGNQPRSIDATGTRLVALLDNNIRGYGDFRNATKCWDVLPSALLLKEAGFKITDVHGFEFDEGIVFNETSPKDNGLNRYIGQNFIAANPADHEELVFGTEDSFWKQAVSEVSNVSGPLELFKSGGHGVAKIKDYTIEDCFYRHGRDIAMILQVNIDEAEKAYGGLDPENVREVVRKVRQNFVDVIPERFFPTDGPIHVDKFDERMSWMESYDLAFN